LCQLVGAIDIFDTFMRRPSHPLSLAAAARSAAANAANKIGMLVIFSAGLHPQSGR